MRKLAKNFSFILLFASGVAIAAIKFVPNQQPYGYIAPPTLSKVNISGGDAVTFVPWFERESFRGDLIAGATSATGVVNLATPLWRAGTVLDAQDWDLGRKIFTMHKDGYAVPFRALSLDNDQMKELENDENERLDFLRGDRSNEGGLFGRVRDSVLGDIIHSNPYYVGVPRAGYAGDGYPAFAYTHRNRPGMVYVGANDGMLHAFDATTGEEKWAYIPSMLFNDAKLGLLAEDPYVHQYYVDGPITVEDAQKADGTWYTVLVGGLGAGGRGLFALDVTSAATPTTEADAATKLMWELSDQDSGNINYTYARTSIVKLNDGKWYAVTGNGYMGGSKAFLLIINLETGVITREIELDGGGDNGLSSPTLVDINKDGTADYAYAGDLNGNMWKIDLTSATPSLWGPAFDNDDKIPLFTTAEDPVTGDFQPITTAPEIGLHPDNGLMVYFATGRLFATEDAQGDEGASVQSVYGIRDNNWDPLNLPIPQTALLNQDLRRGTHADSGTAVRTATNHSINWTTHKGWRTDLQVDSPTTEEIGERVLQDVILKDGRVQFMSTNPTFATGSNWLMQLNASNGGAPGAPVIDLSGDRK
ncbi:MAG: PQQ-binding-like beta-propeller repeat protein, partial [Gammaproteobacteria bacterium]|nr:PQQ-binding-like beta-propeller repeat protein [Gammaproteobacteria bacterium]